LFSSTIIPTVNRPSLSRAVHSVLDQPFDDDDFEVIVVNDSGGPLAPSAWAASPRVRIAETNRRERSVARNAGAALARGTYLNFLDDDDLLAPGALAAWWELARIDAEADWLLGGWRTVDNDGRPCEEFHPPMTGNIFALLVSGEGLPLQASLLRTSRFFDVGGFDPAPELVGVEDRDVGRRMALVSGIAHTPALVAVIRIGAVGSTTDWSIVAEGDRLGREKALAAPGAFPRAWSSAISGYWRGRLGRAYVASAVWNLRRRRVRTAVRRLGSAAIIAQRSALRRGFWHGLRTSVGGRP